MWIIVHHASHGELMMLLIDRLKTSVKQWRLSMNGCRWRKLSSSSALCLTRRTGWFAGLKIMRSAAVCVAGWYSTGDLWIAKQTSYYSTGSQRPHSWIPSWLRWRILTAGNSGHAKVWTPDKCPSRRVSKLPPNTWFFRPPNSISVGPSVSAGLTFMSMRHRISVIVGCMLCCA